jgi:hypothetical protein
MRFRYGSDSENPRLGGSATKTLAMNEQAIEQESLSLIRFLYSTITDTKNREGGEEQCQEHTHHFLTLMGFEVFTAMTMKNAVFRDVTLCGFVRTDVSEERSASIIRVTKSVS